MRGTFNFLLILFSTTFVFGQSGGTNCGGMEPICTDSGVQFTANDGGLDASISEPTNDYNCLGSAPNPSWYYFEISQSGDIIMSLSAPQDIDFIIWGPYSSLANAIANCGSYGTAVPDINCLLPGFMCDSYGCSFDPSNIETPGIPNAQVGEVYVMLVTNYANVIQNITLTQTSGSGATDCTIITPGNCSFGNFTGNLSNCDAATNQYTFSGTIDFTNPPSSGTLTLSNSNGTSQTFNAPFGSSANFSFTGIADGSTFVITASFSNDASCSATLTYVTPIACNCQSQIGTFTTSLSPSPAINKICFGTSFSVMSNDDFTVPGEMIGATIPGSSNYDPTAPTYNPGVIWLAYSCPPSVSLTPAMSNTTGLNIPDDPCLQSIVTSNEDLSDLNDLSFINSFPAGTFTDNIVYFVPITMYSIMDGIYSYVTLPAWDCFDLGDPIIVQYLTDVVATSNSDCATGIVNATFNGSSPALNGTNFNVVSGSQTPTSANFSNLSAANGGTISMTGVFSGAYGFDVIDDNGCTFSLNGSVIGGDVVTLNYPDNLLCISDANQNPSITGTPNGTFSSTTGLNLNANSGLINPSLSQPGTYVITYLSPVTVCPDSDQFSLTIGTNPTLDAGPDQTVCPGQAVILEANGAASYDWSNNEPNGSSFFPEIGINSYIVTGYSSEGCFSSDTLQITVTEDCNQDEVVYYIPNCFTPDDDQNNPLFLPIFYSGIDIYRYELMIFNRWGELIWQSYDPGVGWDGTYNKGLKCPDGVYTWKIKYKTLDNDNKEILIGHVFLLR